jgi:acyl dehydratase
VSGAEAATDLPYPPFVYEVGSEKIREYARAVGEASPFYFDRKAARAAGFRDLVAPPMFCVVYSAGALRPSIADPELGIDLALMVHGGQEFTWSEPVCAGDAITTTARVAEVYEKTGMGFFVFESVSENQEGREVVRGTWTNIVRRAPES